MRRAILPTILALVLSSCPEPKWYSPQFCDSIDGQCISGEVVGEDSRDANGEADIMPEDTKPDFYGLDTVDTFDTQDTEDIIPDVCEPIIPLYEDKDGDGKGAGEIVDYICEGAQVSEGHSLEKGDCNDEDKKIPGPEDLFNGKDDDCDGFIDANSETLEGLRCFGEAGEYLEAIFGCDGSDIDQLLYCTSANVPAHSAKISPVCVYHSELTIGQYRSLVDQGLVMAPKTTPFGYGDESKWDRPMTNLTHEEAKLACKVMGARLPTGHELELVAGALEGCDYATCTDPTGKCHEMGNIGDCSSGQTDPVNGWGYEQDLIGNVAEIAGDKFVEKAGTVATEFDPFVSPSGQFYDMEVRGGSFNDDLIGGNRRSRRGVDANTGADDVGVRCAFSPYGNTRGELE